MQLQVRDGTQGMAGYEGMVARVDEHMAAIVLGGEDSDGVSDDRYEQRNKRSERPGAAAIVGLTVPCACWTVRALGSVGRHGVVAIVLATAVNLNALRLRALNHAWIAYTEPAASPKVHRKLAYSEGQRTAAR